MLPCLKIIDLSHKIKTHNSVSVACSPEINQLLLRSLVANDTECVQLFVCWISLHAFCRLLIFLLFFFSKLTFSKHSYRNAISIKYVGSRSGLAFYWALSGSKLLAKNISRLKLSLATLRVKYALSLSLKGICLLQFSPEKIRVK